MATAYLHRVFWIIPAASQGAFNTWVRNNLNPNGGDTFTIGVSATGTTPATYYIACGAYTVPELKKIAARLCAMSNLTLPADWDTYTRAQKKAWLVSNWPTIRNKTGIKAIVLDDNDGTWSDYAATLASAGLKVIRPVGRAILAPQSAPEPMRRGVDWQFVWRGWAMVATAGTAIAVLIRVLGG